eukprot:s186_g17.t1
MRELERQLQELRRDKVKIDDHIRRMEAAQKRFTGDEDRSKLTALHSQEEKDDKEKKEDGEDGEEKEKKEEKEDEDGEKKEQEESRKRKREDDVEQRKKEGRPTKADPRSRNLFGKLLGHLQSAKDRLQKEKTSKVGELQQKALMKVEEKVNLSKMNLKEFRRGEFTKTLEEEQARVLEIEKQIEQKEVVLLQRRLENHYSLMMNFIRTEVSPPIFFLPAKHTRDTEKQLEATRAGIKGKIAALKHQLPQVPEVEMKGAEADKKEAEPEAPAAEEAAEAEGNGAAEAKEDDASDSS